ncbi:MAG: PHP domain-containing protein [Anaerovoracaceae bacterium]
MEKMIFDYHTHTTFSHGKGSIEDNVKAAIARGLKALAITDHGPGHLTYGVKREDFPKMRQEIEALQKKYPQLQIYLGVEANICNQGNFLDITPEEAKTFDFLLAGYHYGIRHGYCIWNFLYSHGIKLFGKALKRKNTEMTIKAIETNKIKILTHPGDKGPFDLLAIAKACASHGVWMEISTHHDHLTLEEIQEVMDTGVNFVVSSDAHVPFRVGDFEAGAQRAMAAGLSIDRIVNIEKIRGER